MTPQSQNVEWKSSWRDEHLKWICGFANAQGGVLGIGRNDCGEVVGVRGARQLLAEIPDKVQSLLGIVVDVDVDSEGGVHRVETFPVPREAMREAVVNAIVHRDYASPATIQIRVYDDRISIWNPAHLSPDWAAEQLAEEHSSRPHNPRVAQVFFRAGMIEAWGRGIRRIVDLCHDAGNPTPTWTLEARGGGLWVRFPFSEGYQAADAAARGCADPGTTQNPTRNSQNTTRIHQKTAQISQKTTRDRILDYLRAEPELTRRELAVRVGVTPDGVKYHLRRLKAAGVIYTSLTLPLTSTLLL